MEYAMRFRLYPNAEQRILIAKTFGCCRYVYNHYLSKRKYIYEQDGTTLSWAECMRDLTVMKKSITWLSEVDSIALQSSIRDLDTAYRNFWRPRPGRSRGQDRATCRSRQDNGWCWT